MKLLIKLILWLWDISPVGYVLRYREMKRELHDLERQHHRLLGDVRDLHFWFNERDHPQLVLGTAWALRRDVLRKHQDSNLASYDGYDFLDGHDISRLREFINSSDRMLLNGEWVAASLTTRIQQRREVWKRLTKVS